MQNHFKVECMYDFFEVYIGPTFRIQLCGIIFGYWEK